MSDTKAVEGSGADVIYLSNLFPSAVEPYVGEEIEELERRGIRVAACSVWGGGGDWGGRSVFQVFSWRPWDWLRAVFLCVERWRELSDFFRRLLGSGGESWWQRARGVVHTLLGARLALAFRDSGVRHIHVHHGYLAAWIGMVAARLLGVSYSMTLHGSDLLVRPSFLDMKLQHCALCFTVSEFNRDYVLRRYAEIEPGNVAVRRMGVIVPTMDRTRELWKPGPFVLLAVGRLHAVKDHAFLIRACAALKASGSDIVCRIAGEGPERWRLEDLIRSLGVQVEVQLLGHVPRSDLAALYREADLVVLTSRSEGIPLTLTEAMAWGRLVLAPAITGIPELVKDGKTGFLYRQGSITDFVGRVEFVRRTQSALGSIGEAAREHVRAAFNLETNLREFGDLFVERFLGAREGVHADSLLQ